jgi:hypothetical protein
MLRPLYPKPKPLSLTPVVLCREGTRLATCLWSFCARISARSSAIS